MSAVHQDEQYITPEGQRLYYQVWAPQTPPKAIIVATHGFGEHSARYREFAQKVVEAGFAIHFYDLRGHGQSEGRRAYIEKFEYYVNDLCNIIDKARRDSDVPLFLFAHSYGALITATYLRNPHVPVTACAMTSPFWGWKIEVPAWKSLSAKALSSIMPTFAMPTGFGGEVLTHDQAIVQAYNNDPLVLKKVTAGWFVRTVSAQKELESNASDIKVPLKVYQAGDDRLVDPKTSQRIVEQGVSSEEKHFSMVDGSFHEILNEPEHKGQVTEEIIAWYEKFLS